VDSIKRIEQARKSRVLVYFTGDRQGIPSRVAEDAVLPLYRHLLALESGERGIGKIDLFLYTRGGDVGVPWRIVTMIREFASEFAALVPYRAHSAGTMIALGADRIIMGKKAELSPIDPSLYRATMGESTAPPPEVSVEDVSSYVSFMRDRAKITDQTALAQVISQLANQLTPLTLGSVNRQYSHIRLVASKLLISRKRKIEESTIATIIDALTEKMYSHGHAIGRKEAQELGLPVERPSKEIELLMWDLYQEYESFLLLGEPIDPEELLRGESLEEVSKENVPLAVIESIPHLDVFELNLAFQRRRQMPSNPQVNINLNVGLPPGLNPADLSTNSQQVLQHIMKQVSDEVPRLVQKEIARQSPIVGVEGRSYGGKWKRKE
jgi:hypothetical protein